MKEITICKGLDVRASRIKGVIKIDDTYINGINVRIQDYLIKYGELPLIQIKYGYIENRGITLVDIEVQDGITSQWKVESN